MGWGMIDEGRGLSVHPWERQCFSDCKPDQTRLIKRRGSWEHYGFMKTILKAVIPRFTRLSFRAECLCCTVVLLPVCERKKNLNGQKKTKQKRRTVRVNQSSNICKQSFFNNLFPNNILLETLFHYLSSWNWETRNILISWKSSRFER